MAKRELVLKPGYRWLAAGEVVVAEDEYWSPNLGQWAKTAFPGAVVEAAPSRDTISYRRKVDAAEPHKVLHPDSEYNYYRRVQAAEGKLHEITKPESGQKHNVEVRVGDSWQVFDNATNLTQEFVSGFHTLKFTRANGLVIEVVTRETVVITPVTSV
jgi:hypothetical protein